MLDDPTAEASPLRAESLAINTSIQSPLKDIAYNRMQMLSAEVCPRSEVKIVRKKLNRQGSL